MRASSNTGLKHGVNVLLIGIVVAGLSAAPLAAGDGLSEDQLKKIEGDYTIAVHPEPFGFFVKGGTLHLKLGGLAGDGQVVPLIEEDGKFIIAPGHPNAFEFKEVGGQIEFTFWAGDTSQKGTRVSGADADEETAGKTAEPVADAAAERTRPDVLAELAEAEAAFKGNPSNAATRLAYGELLFQAGEFWKAREAVLPLVEADDVSTEALAFAAKLEYLTGNYDRAEPLYNRVIEANEGNPGGQVMAMVGLAFTHYQTGDFKKAGEIAFPEGVQLPNVDLMKSFEDQSYQLEWANEERMSTVPFLLTDPLPVFTVEINGVPIHVIFDTGGADFILDSEIAEALGVEEVASAMGSFAGGQQSAIGFGRVETLEIGDVTIRSVPVMTLPTKRFSSGFADGKYPIGGILGTQTVRQFLATLDYKDEQIVLRERTNENAAALRRDLEGGIAAEVPFVLDATHLMMARGSLNGKDGLTYFVDSGLASEACFIAKKQTLELAGIPIPELQPLPEGSVGGGGGTDYEEAEFPLESIGLGTLVQSDRKGEIHTGFDEGYWTMSGYIRDGLISHQFLRQYSSWTLDFDSMTYIFEE